jgi:hypothetical protein
VTRLRDAGAPELEVATTVAALAERAGTRTELVSSFMGTLVLGMVLSLVIARLLRRRAAPGSGSTASRGG